MTHHGGARTPEFKRSNRILVPSSHSRGNGSISSGISSSNFSSSSGGSNQPPLFVPKRRSFGIVIKAHDPDRIPSRARRSRSRSRSGSRSSSISSLRSALNRAKSRSLGDIDMEGESIVEEEVDRRRSKDINRHLSFRNLSSSPRGRSLSRGSMGSQDSGTSIDFVKSATEINSSRRPIRRERSNEFSESVKANIPDHKESVSRRDRSSSQSTLEVNFRLDNQRPQETKKERKRGKAGDVETRSRAAQYELVQQKRRPSENNSERNPNSTSSNQKFALSADVHRNAETNSPVHQTKMNSQQNFPINNTHVNENLQQDSTQKLCQRPEQPLQNNFLSSASRANPNFSDQRFHHQASLSSDEGTDLDEIAWGRTEDFILSPMDNQMIRDERQNTPSSEMHPASAPSINRSYMGTGNSGSSYTNIEEMQPMLPPKNPPKLPPKISIPQQHVNQFTEVLHHSHSSNKENVHTGQFPPAIPPKSFSPRLHTENQRGHFSNGPHSPPWSVHQPANSGYPFRAAPQQQCCGSHVGVQGFTGSNQVNSTVHQHNQVTSRSRYNHSTNHATSCCNESFHSPIPPNPGYQGQQAHFAQMISPEHQCNGIQESAKSDHGDIPHHTFGSPHTVKFIQGSPKPNVRAQNLALLNSQRQFKSTANFRNAGLLPANQNMYRAKSTDVLSFGGRITSDPEIDNLDCKIPSKKTKSRIVLDDISLTSLEEFQGKSNKPKLSEEPKRGKLEMWSGLLHLFTICSCLLTTVTLAIVSKKWDFYANKCPLYVSNNLAHDRFWGNPSMVPCYMSAYLPLLVILISVGLVFVHGGLLVFWRSDRKSSSYYMTRSFGVTVTFLNVVAFAVALAVSCVLTDGLRQTCLSFMLITDYNFRPVNCQMGFDSLDLNYNMRGTLYLIGFGILGAWLSVIFTLISVVMYTIRAGCCRCTLH